MAYSDFTLKKVKKAFDLHEQAVPLFPHEGTLEASQWLQDTLAMSVKLALSSSSEKARSEFIVAPILLEVEHRNKDELALFSGERLDVDEQKGLKGECDFILSKGPLSSTIQAPILALVEAKKNDIKGGLGQCVAQMIGATRFNQEEGNDIDSVYGCVTTGEDWQFVKLEGQVILMDVTRCYLNELRRVLWIFQSIIDGYKTKTRGEGRGASGDRNARHPCDKGDTRQQQ